MGAPKSKQLPGVSGGTESVTGTKEIDTGLRKILGFVCSINASAMTDDAEFQCSWKITDETGPTVKVTLYVWKATVTGVSGATGVFDMAAGTTAKDVSWLAVGN